MACRVDEAIELVKALASKHGSMKQATLNSLIRSLSDVGQVARALRLLSIMLNMALKPYRSTINALIAACARESHSLEAGRLYWCAPSCLPLRAVSYAGFEAQGWSQGM